MNWEDLNLGERGDDDDIPAQGFFGGVNTITADSEAPGKQNGHGCPNLVKKTSSHNNNFNLPIDPGQPYSVVTKQIS